MADNENDFFKDDFDFSIFEDKRSERENELRREALRIEKQKNEKEKSIYSKMISLLSIFLSFGFLIFLFFLSVTDTEKTVSQAEKRTLALKPEFSISEFFSGKWSAAYEDYYSDNFPMRDAFISVSKKIETVFTRFSTSGNNSVIVKIEKNEDDFAGEGITFKEQQTTSSSEQTTAENPTQKNGKNEKYADDKDAKITRSVLIVDKRAMEMFGYTESLLKNYANLINNVADKIGNSAQVYSLVAPTSVEFYGTKEYRTGYHSQYDAINKLYSYMNDNVKTVNAYSELSAHSDDYIYFRTDHHWTARGAYYAYTALCDLKHIAPRTLETYASHGKIPGDFLGTLYDLTKSDVLAKNPDYVEYFCPEGVDGYIYDNAQMTNPTNFLVVAKNTSASNKYLAFIAGDQPLEKIVTPNKNGKKIIVLKESYGNAFVPFLCNDYEEIYVVDPRKLTFDLKNFVAANSINDVLLINYAFAIGNKTYTDAVWEMIK